MTAASTLAKPEPILKVDHLTMRFGGLVAVNDVSFEAPGAAITAVIGPNGAGKTTMFNCLTGFYKPTEGMLALTPPSRPDEPKREPFLLERMEGHDIAEKAGVARTFQNIRLFGNMSVLENLLVAQHNRLMKAAGVLSGLFGLPKYRHVEDAAIDRAVYWLDKVRLLDRADMEAGNLPYGAQRRLEIARAMCTDPVLLCLDEPAAGLNPRETAELNDLITAIRDEHGTAVLLIEHDMSVVMRISDHVIVLDYGQKISDGSPDFVRNDPAVIRAYLGQEEDEDLPPEVEADVAQGRAG